MRRANKLIALRCLKVTVMIDSDRQTERVEWRFQLGPSFHSIRPRRKALVL
jgi:hypothetical protein